MDIVCRSCKTVFKGEIAKDFTTCPVCGAVIDHFDMEDKELQKELEEADKSMLHFSEIDRYGLVIIECSKCLIESAYTLKEIDESNEGTYIKIKPNVTVKCFNCGYIHTKKYLTFGEVKMPGSLGPRCPKCKSLVLHKIGLFSKLVAAGALGSDAIPYNSCTYECVNCGHRF